MMPSQKPEKGVKGGKYEQGSMVTDKLNDWNAILPDTGN